jgi:hypothetical protein
VNGSRQAPIRTLDFAKPLSEINNLAKIYRGPNLGADPQVAVAVHRQDADVVGEPVEQRAGKRPVERLAAFADNVPFKHLVRFVSPPPKKNQSCDARFRRIYLLPKYAATAAMIT